MRLAEIRTQNHSTLRAARRRCRRRNPRWATASQQPVRIALGAQRLVSGVVTIAGRWPLPHSLRLRPYGALEGAVAWGSGARGRGGVGRVRATSRDQTTHTVGLTAGLMAGHIEAVGLRSRGICAGIATELVLRLLGLHQEGQQDHGLQGPVGAHRRVPRVQQHQGRQMHAWLLQSVLLAVLHARPQASSVRWCGA